MTVDAAAYDAWYETARGGWIGERESTLLRDLLDPRPGETLLDVGCGTGYFTRRLAGDGHWSVGIDRDHGRVRHAAGRGCRCLVADAARLPFPDRSFDLAMAVTSLCFMADPAAAVAEMARVARRRVALGLLNRRSLLWLEKGRGGGRGAYGGARWHTAGEALRLLDGLAHPCLAWAVYFPGAGSLARWLEPRFALLGMGGGAFLAVAADKP